MNYKVGQKVRIVGDTRYDHNFKIGSVVEVTYLVDLDLECEGFCEDRGYVDTQLLYLEDIIPLEMSNV